MATKKFQVVLEIECEVGAPVTDAPGLTLDNPLRWDYTALLGGADFPSVTAKVLKGFEACCEAKVEWVIGECEWAFEPSDHDETCANFVGDDDEADEMTLADVLTDEDEQMAVVFGGAFEEVN